jgi:hypothetical protein
MIQNNTIIYNVNVFGVTNIMHRHSETANEKKENKLKGGTKRLPSVAIKVTVESFFKNIKFSGAL